ncbi:adaptin ear-binding coat-associated protein 1 [Limosa lapponica baueri]|uniref:Adaptin ear-binding coat-associated protein 1 n=1 Tax=Limosa lapponica baueri TaxID=1758121 RepID=A0A2I0U0R8_LIMLA|nr:adaptin ear-binding coat-associated protein 1 [Limosa lapponica baueri]
MEKRGGSRQLKNSQIHLNYGKAMAQVILETISRHKKDKVIGMGCGESSGCCLFRLQVPGNVSKYIFYPESYPHEWEPTIFHLAPLLNPYILETWWEDLHNWSAANNGYQLFRRDRQGRRAGGVALYVRDIFECLELNNVNDSVECLWVRIKGKANKADIMVGVYYRPPNQDVEIDEIFYQQLAELSQSLTLVLVGDFNFPDISWEYNMAEREQPRRFLEYVDDNFLMQVVSGPTRESALLDLLLVNRDELVGEVKVGGRLGHSDHETIGFSILGETRRGITKTATLDFLRANFDLFRRLLDKIP